MPPVLLNVLLGFIFGAWIVFRLYDTAIPVARISPSRIREAISDGPRCPFSVNIEDGWKNRKKQLMLGGRIGADFFIGEKLVAVVNNIRDVEMVVDWIYDQLQINHLVLDVFTSEKVWLSVLGVSVLNAVTYLLDFESVLLVTDVSNNTNEMRRAEAVRIETTMRKFIVEKILVLAYVVIKSPQENIKSLPTTNALDWLPHLSDTTVFAVWFTLVWSISSVTISCNHRLEMMSDVFNAKEPGRVALVRVLGVLLACFCASSAMTSLGITSFRLIHPLYAGMFTIEGTKLLVRSAFVLGRACSWMAGGSNASYQTRVYFVKRIAGILLNILNAIQYALYLVVGTLLNGKLITIVFVSKLCHHLRCTVSIISDQGLDVPQLID